jgi:hypothetical protein
MNSAVCSLIARVGLRCRAPAPRSRPQSGSFDSWGGPRPGHARAGGTSSAYCPRPRRSHPDVTKCVVQRQDGGYDRTGIEPGRLPLEQRGRQVLKRDRGLDESGVVLGHPPVVERRARYRPTAEKALDRLRVRAFVRAYNPGERQRPGLDRAEALGLGVEPGLEIFEREIEAQDRGVIRVKPSAAEAPPAASSPAPSAAASGIARSSSLRVARTASAAVSRSAPSTSIAASVPTRSSGEAGSPTGREA